jgi:hypothetical protein
LLSDELASKRVVNFNCTHVRTVPNSVKRFAKLRAVRWSAERNGGQRFFARPPPFDHSHQPFTPFLPATVFFLPLRVREFERVRWPLTGKLLR